MLVWIAAQSAHLELAAGLQGTYDSASLLPRCADHGDQFLLLDDMSIPFLFFFLGVFGEVPLLNLRLSERLPEGLLVKNLLRECD